jgi:hypothetical protein
MKGTTNMVDRMYAADAWDDYYRDIEEIYSELTVLRRWSNNIEQIDEELLQRAKRIARIRMLARARTYTEVSKILYNSNLYTLIPPTRD